jgi:hypothetical protein
MKTSNQPPNPSRVIPIILFAALVFYIVVMLAIFLIDPAYTVPCHC